MPHGKGYGNDKKMPMKKGKKYNSNEGGMYEGYDNFEGSMPETQSSDSYFRPMDSYPGGKNPHEY